MAEWMERQKGSKKAAKKEMRLEMLLVDLKDMMKVEKLVA